MPRTSRSLPAPRPDDTCSVCNTKTSCRPVGALHPSLLKHLEGHGLDATSEESSVCAACLSSALSRHSLTELKRKRAPLSDVEKEISDRAASIADEIEQGVPASFGQRAADQVARIGGSWGFVLSFIAVILSWAAVNTFILATGAFDPFPYIFLNLVLSCLSAIQAPIILMSQSRMSQVDRIRATEDFRINLKAELEVASLHEKMDHLLHQQWDRLLELQQVQLEILEELRRDSPGSGPTGAPPAPAEPVPSSSSSSPSSPSSSSPSSP
jgi:uncharacterized membrane protein